MTEIRDRVDAIVDDPATAEALKPWYRQLCKRPCFHDDFLSTFNRPNVHLVDTDGRGVASIDATGCVVDGVHFDLDCLIFASGFEVGTPLARRAGFETVGRDGITLSDHWSEGMLTLHGIHVAGFPNVFIVGLAQAANLVSNVTHNLVDAATTIATVIAHALDVGAEVVEATSAAEAAWVALVEQSPRSFFNNPECTPGYYNGEGALVGQRELRNVSGYPDGAVAYFHYIDRWRKSGDFVGLTFTGARPTGNPLD